MLSESERAGWWSELPELPEPEWPEWTECPECWLPTTVIDDADAEQVLERLREPMRLADYEHRVALRMPCPVEEVPEAVRYGGTEVRGLGPEESEIVTGAEDPRAAAVWLACLECDFSVVGDDAVREAVRSLAERLRVAAGD